MSDALELLVARGVLEPFDRHFARTLGTMVAAADEVLLAAALTTAAARQGHVCFDLARASGRGLWDRDGQPVTEVRLPTVEAWKSAVEHSQLVSDGSRPSPLVLEDSRLYLARYHAYELRLADALIARARDVPEVRDDVLAAGLARLFPEDREGPPSGQQLACAVAVLRRFAVISGGPGTGKTTLVVKILALLQEQARAMDRPPLRIQLLAPTGKAAQRLGDAVTGQKAIVACDPEIVREIPDRASTIHRALGPQPWAPVRFRHGRGDPLVVDVVVVDEASMVDLALMCKLVDALEPTTRLVLVGDENQLASVEAGSILGDLYAAGGGPGPSREFAARVGALIGRDVPCSVTGIAPLCDGLVRLERGHRYRSDSAVGRLAQAIHGGDAEAALALLDGADGIELVHPEGARLVEAAVAGYRDVLEADSPEERLRALHGFRILCAHRRGRLGAERLVVELEAALTDRGWLRREGAHYRGRPVMVLQNDSELNLFNGDVGVIERDGAGLACWFPEGSGLRKVAVARLPVHETVFATTVHKSQGSEFGRVMIVLPERISPVTTRELLYTAVTRARSSVSLVATPELVRAAIAQRVERTSGLHVRLRSTNR